MRNDDYQIPTMLTINEASEITRISAYRIRQLCIMDRIVYIRAGNKYLINLEKLIQYLNGDNSK